MLAQELASTTVREEEHDPVCPDCYSPLTTSYDWDKRKYLCENCGEEMSARDVGSEDKDGEDNIYIVTTGNESNRRFF